MLIGYEQYEDAAWVSRDTQQDSYAKNSHAFVNLLGVASIRVVFTTTTMISTLPTWHGRGERNMAPTGLRWAIECTKARRRSCLNPSPSTFTSDQLHAIRERLTCSIGVIDHQVFRYWYGGSDLGNYLTTYRTVIVAYCQNFHQTLRAGHFVRSNVIRGQEKGCWRCSSV